MYFDKSDFIKNIFFPSLYIYLNNIKYDSGKNSLCISKILKSKPVQFQQQYTAYIGLKMKISLLDNAPNSVVKGALSKEDIYFFQKIAQLCTTGHRYSHGKLQKKKAINDSLDQIPLLILSFFFAQNKNRMKIKKKQLKYLYLYHCKKKIIWCIL